MADLPEVIEQDEKALLQKELNKLERYPKLNKWLQLFLDRTNKQTFGNRTQSAIVAYDLDPVNQYRTAMTMGWENYRKLETVASQYLEAQGMTAGKVIDLITAHAVNKGGKALEMLGYLTGVYNPKLATINIQNNTQVNNNTTVTMDDPNIKTFQQDFAEFLEGKYNAKK